MIIIVNYYKILVRLLLRPGIYCIFSNFFQYYSKMLTSSIDGLLVFVFFIYQNCLLISSSDFYLLIMFK